MFFRQRRANKRNISKRVQARGHRSAGFESLESRHLLSSVALNDDGIVEVEGTDDADVIAAFVDGEQFIVEINGASIGFNNEDVEALYVEGKGGADDIRVASSVVQPTLIFGGTGDDTIQGGAGVDVILGGSDNDTIYGNTANDVLLGDGPNSLEEVPLPQPDEPPMALAADTPLIVDPTPLDLADPDQSPLGLYRYLSRISGINAGSDTIVAGTGSDLVFAGRRNDSVTGDGANLIPVVDVEPVEPALALADSVPDIQPPGNDYIEAGSGNDKVDAGYGANLVFGGTGSDVLHSGGGRDIVIGGSGRDVIRTNGGADIVLGDGPATINQVIVSAADVYLANSALGWGRDYVEAGAGNDMVYAGRGGDAVFAGAGDDFAHGGPGHDVLVGGDGHDNIRAGRGNDAALGDGPNSLTQAILPFDPLMPADDPSWFGLLLANSRLGRGEDTIDGGAGNDLLLGGRLNDQIFGRTGNDVLHGGRGDDQLYDDLNSGGAGVDIFIGGAGADRIFANDGPGGPVDFIFFDEDDELHVDGEDELIEV